MNQEKPKFYHNNDSTKPITGGGVLIYKNVNNTMQLLIRDNDNKLEDIGGEMIAGDITIYDMVARVVAKETNNVINNIKSRIMNSYQIYTPHSKYIIFIVEAKKSEIEYDFGNIKTIDWISLATFIRSLVIRYKLNIRLRNKNLFAVLRDIESFFCYKNMKNIYLEAKLDNK